MKLEVHSAADFLMNLLRVKQVNSLPDDNQLQNFKGSLESLLVLRYRSHWYPDVPTKGSGYRCIRINGKMDPLIEQAGVAVGLPPPTLRKMLPTELTLWIDPEEVAYRIGENGSICVLYDSQSRASPSSDLDSTGSGSSHLSSDEFIMERRTDLYLERNVTKSPPSSTSSVSNSTNSTPTKPTTAASINEGRYYPGYGGHSSPYQRGGGHKYQPHQQANHQFHRQQPHINGNNVTIHNQHQYLHQSPMPQHQWDAFPNSNKVSSFYNVSFRKTILYIRNNF